ncbi:hypothetical protein RDV64_02220 [Acuticoccus sp. MNP-M23]|uniref:hypothetical protein n=1 Tax=Acuticoccus sp. MNP-M23 TaxID=3072793 RepID=UPI00281649E6|nr:hypothetical protein [Acuticoccus sp. MNP-M23]WMS43239.1 hypothetical protein RDV64_02220 [Acuticoccus sp. MNP-M23]
MAVIFGSNGDDNLNGTPEGDLVLANQGSDTITTGAGNDTIMVTAGQGSGSGSADTIDGGEGADSLILSGAIADFDVIFDGDTVQVLGKPGTDAEGFNETLTSIETIAFDDGAMRIVDADGGEGAFTTIQSAVDASEAGDIVVVKAGTYAETVTVETSLTLIGDPAGTIIDSPGNGYGIGLSGDIDDASGGTGSVTIDGFEFTGNSTGVKSFSGLNLDTLIVTNSNFHDNTTAGLAVNQDRVANITISESEFEDNGVGNRNSGSIVLFEYTGNVTIENTTINSTSEAADGPGYALQIAGFEQSTYDVTSPIGNVTMTNVDITGEYVKPAMLIQGYTDLSGFSATDVTLTGETSYQNGDFAAMLFVDPVGSSGTDTAGATGYPGNLLQTGSSSTFDLSGITVNGTGSASINVVVRGLDGDDVITGTDANDALNMPAEGNTDFGGNDTVSGGGGNDVLVGGIGDDSLDGGTGYDIVYTYGNRDDYTITDNGDGTYVVTDNDSVDGGDEGTDQLSNVEAIGFSGDEVIVELGKIITLRDGDGNFLGSFDNLEAAVAAAASGDSLVLGEGEIALEDPDNADGQVMIDKDLTITGAGAELSTLLAQANTGGGSSGTPGAAAILVAEGANVDFSDLGIDGNGNKVHTGLMFKGSGSVDSADFSNIEYGKYVGIAVGIYGAASDVDITNSNFSDIARIGAHYKGEGVTGDFTGNTYTGKGAGDHIDYAVEAGAGAQIVIEGNTISDNIGVAASDGSNSAGVLVTTYFGDGTSATITDNTFDNNTLGVGVGYDENDTSEVSFTGTNTFTGGEDAVAVTGNAVVNNIDTISGDGSTVSWNGGAGVNVVEGAGLDDDLGGGAGSDSITGNGGDDTIDGGEGIDTAVFSGDMADYSIDLETGEVTDNNSSDGDDGTDTTTGIERFQFADASTLVVGSDGYPTIQSAVDAASAGDTIVVLAGNYGGTVSIDKQLTILGADAGIAFNGSRGTGSTLTGGFHFQSGSAGTVIDGFNLVAGAAILGSLTTAYVQADDVTILNSVFDRGQEASFDSSRGIETAIGSGSGLTVQGSSFVQFHTGVYVNPGAEGVTVTGNGFAVNKVGLSNDDPDDFTLSDNLFNSNEFEQVGIGVADETEDLSAQIAETNSFANTGSTPIVSIYPLSGETQTITGTAFADTFNGDQTSTDADQQFNGLGGDDIINAGGGNDTLIGGTGADAMTGGTGDDFYEVDNAGDTVFEFDGEGTDTVDVSLASYTLGANVENGIITYDETYSLSGNNLANDLVGGDNGGTLKGFGGMDTMTGGDGEDTLDGGGGVDWLDGAEGDDRYLINDQRDNIEDTGTSTGDAIVTRTTNVDLRDYIGVEKIVMQKGEDLSLSGDDGDNVLRGNNGDNLIIGRDGRDVMTGGNGDDVFDFNNVSESSLSETDLIRDFEVATVEGIGDVIDLFGIDAKSTALFNNAFTFIGTDAFSMKEGELRYTNDGGSTYIEGDVNGNGEADLYIRLLGELTLSDADFVL